MDATTIRLWTRFHDRCKPLTEDGGIMATDWLFDTEIYRLYGEIMGHETGAMLAWPPRWLARSDRGAAHSSPGFLAHVHRGYARSIARYRENLERLDVFRRAAVDRVPEGAALVLPVSGVCAFRHLAPSRDRNGVRSYSQKFALNGGAFGYLDALTRFTVPPSLLGWPVVTLPVDRDENGLPFGVQLSAPPGSEAELFSLAELVQDTLASESN